MATPRGHWRDGYYLSVAGRRPYSIRLATFARARHAARRIADRFRRRVDITYVSDHGDSRALIWSSVDVRPGGA